MNWLANLETATASMPAWFAVLIDAAIRSCLVLLMAWTVVTGARRASAASRHFIWLAAFASLVALPLVSSLAPSWFRYISSDYWWKALYRETLWASRIMQASEMADMRMSPDPAMPVT